MGGQQTGDGADSTEPHPDGFLPGSFTPLVRIETTNAAREKARHRSLVEVLQQEGCEDGQGVVFPAELVRMLDRLEDEIRQNAVSEESRVGGGGVHSREITVLPAILDTKHFIVNLSFSRSASPRIC